MLISHGAIRLPKGILKRIKANSFSSRWQSEIRRRQVSQGEIESEVAELVLGRMEHLLGRPIHAKSSDTGYLAFRQVDRHKDDWPHVRFNENGPRKAAGFLHVCIGGHATIKSGKKVLTVKRGDVFSLNPNAWHSVTSETLCVTICFTTPRAELTKSPEGKY